MNLEAVRWANCVSRIVDDGVSQVCRIHGQMMSPTLDLQSQTISEVVVERRFQCA